MKKFVIMSLILLLGGFLRLYNLAQSPSGFNADEAALGYNAYSLLQTGKDEHGHPWPINFESFGDFKPALYGYVLMPFVKVLGLTPLAVRLPAALAGIFSIILIYLIAKEMFSEQIATISSIYLAVSPWNLHFSRGAWEVNLASAFILFAIWSFLKWIKNPRFLYLGACVLGFVLSMYTYQSSRLLAPLLAIGLLTVYRPRLWTNRLQVVSACVVGIVLLIPLLYTFVFSNAISRATGVGLLADLGPTNRVNELRGQYSNPNSYVARLLHNKIVSYSFAFVENYSDHFSGDFLFVNGDAIERSKIPETGLLYWTDVLLIFLGLIYLVKNRGPKYIFIWWLLAPLAAGLTFQTPHALRAQMMIFPLTIIIAVGISSLSKKINILLVLVLLLVVYAWQGSRYLHEYYSHYPKTYPAAWEYGFDQVVSFVESHKNEYNQVLVTTKYDQPYVLFLFYSKFPPEKFQFQHQLTVRDKFNFSTVNSYDKYIFTDTAWDKVRTMQSTLVVAAPEDIPASGANVIKVINFPNGQPAFKIVSI